MSAGGRVARTGAVAFAVGLSLAGPNATGVAGAEPADDGTASVSTPQHVASVPRVRGSRQAGNEQVNGRVRGGRTIAGASAATDHEAPMIVETASDAIPPRAGGRRVRQSAGTPSGGAQADNSSPTGGQSQSTQPGAGSAIASTLNSNAGASASGSQAGVLTVSHPAPAASTVALPRALPHVRDLVNSVFAGPQPRPDISIAAIGTAVNNLFDSAAHWLSGLPASHVTDFFEGALLLVRRTLLSLLSALRPDQTAGQASGTNGAYFTDALMRAYLLNLAKQRYGALFGTTVPVYGYGPYGPHPEYLKMDAVSGTNTQVEGIDEADFVENDGTFIYTAHDGQLTIVRAADLSVVSQSAIAGYVAGQYLSGDRLTVITQSGTGWYGPWVKMAYPGYWGPWNPQTTVTVYDLSDRTAPTVVNQTVFDGAYQDSRSVDGVVYVVMQRAVNLPAPHYTETPINYLDNGFDEGDPHVGEAMIRYDPGAPIGYRTYETWDEYVARVGGQIVQLSLPHAYSVDAEGNTVDLGLIAGAEETVRPHSDNQQTVLTVVSVNSAVPSGGQAFAGSVASMVSGSGNTVYMNTGALYVGSAENHSSETGWSTDTRIDRFTLSGTHISWQATGVVSGTLINQFAMDERDGYLRVVTHRGDSALVNGVWTNRNDNGIYILDTAGDTLDEVGRLTGLAPGEQLYAVRYVGNTAYLVTFVRTDPLFAIDLSQPTAPRLLGELVVPGFSNYLQSVGDGLLLGIGQEREEGSWNTHVHATLFDVSDGADLNQIERVFLDPGYQWSWSDAQFDHHAVLYSAEDGLLVVPVSGSGYDTDTGYRYGQYLKVLRVGPNGIEVLGEIQTDEPTLRTVRIGDVLYAVGSTTVTAYQLSDLSEIGRSAPVPSVV